MATEKNQDQNVSEQSTYNPFLDNVNEKPYSQVRVDASPSQMYNPIPEPSFGAGSMSSGEDIYGKLNGDFSPSGGASAMGMGMSAGNNELSDQDKKIAAEQMAKMMVDVYGEVKNLSNNLLLISTKKIKKLESEGEIDTSATMPLNGQTITIGEFVEQYNEQVKGTLSLSKEFRKEIMPPLTRVLMKRGAGLSDEGLIYYIVGKDLAMSIAIVYQHRMMVSDALDTMKEYTQAVKKTGQAPAASFNNTASTSPTPETKPTPRPNPPQPTTPVVDTNAPDFNFAMNEVVLDSAVQKHQVPPSGKERLMAQKKRDKEIQEAIAKHSPNPIKPTISYDDAASARKVGKRGRKPKDYTANIDEAQIAEAIVLSETKTGEDQTEKIEGLD